jgi:hypothetical protein
VKSTLPIRRPESADAGGTLALWRGEDMTLSATGDPEGLHPLLAAPHHALPAAVTRRALFGTAIAG